MYKFISWNVNGLRAVCGKGFADIFTELDADFFCLQETKLQEGQIDLEFLGYRSYWNYADKKGYSGTAIFTRHEPLSVSYGIGIDENSPIRPVATLKTRILQIKELGAEETVGYNRKGKLNKASRIAAIPIGYADGLSRAFGNGNGYVMINSKKAPFVGNICMDVCMIDITDIENVNEGDMVTIFGTEPSISELSKKTNTITYEILTSISKRVKRIYYQE